MFLFLEFARNLACSPEREVAHAASPRCGDALEKDLGSTPPVHQEDHLGRSQNQNNQKHIRGCLSCCCCCVQQSQTAFAINGCFYSLCAEAFAINKWFSVQTSASEIIFDIAATTIYARNVKKKELIANVMFM